MKKNPLILVIVIALLATGAAVGLSFAFRDSEPPPKPKSDDIQRIVSLMPPITETLFEIGAGEQVVGRSNWCEFPPQVKELPSCGNALTPNAEAIVRLKPTLIIAPDSQGTARDKLSPLGHTVYLPWLTIEDVIRSTRELGRLTGHSEEADRLADELERTLLVPAPEDGPKVLLVNAFETQAIDSVSFLRRNSMHGRMIHAAGARNAVDEDVGGVPTISLERVIELDPDIIIMLDARDAISDEERTVMIGRWDEAEPLRAVKEGRVGVLNGSHFYGAGRRLIRAVEELRAEIDKLERDGE